MSAYRENAEQLEPTARCSGCGEPVDPSTVEHFCRATGDVLDRLMLCIGFHRRVVDYDPVDRVPVLEGDEAFRARVMATIERKQ